MRSSEADFVNHSYDYWPNWTPLSPITIIKQGKTINQVSRALSVKEILARLLR